MKTMNLTLMLLFLAVISFAQVPSYVPANGLVGWWPFNGNANDESGNGNNGTVNGATLTADRFGNVNKAYSFDGVDDFIQISNTSSLNFTSGTINIWLNTSQSSFAALVEKLNYTNAGNENWAISINQNSISSITFFTKQNSNCTPGFGWLTNNISSTINNSSWHMITCVMSLNNSYIYADGILISTIPSITFDTCPGDIQIARHWSNDPRRFSGFLDDIGIWNRALTQQEITDLFNANICYQLVTVTDTLLINTGSITGFNPLSYENTIKIWPNPSNSQITIDAGDLNLMNGYSIRIVNSLGQQMFQTALTQQQYVLNLSSWTGPGLYYVNIVNSQGVTTDTRKIRIQ